MIAILYREIITFLKNQRDVLNTFENERKYIMIDNSDVRKLFGSLKHNLNLLETNINNCLDKEEKHEKSEEN